MKIFVLTVWIALLCPTTILASGGLSSGSPGDTDDGSKRNKFLPSVGSVSVSYKRADSLRLAKTVAKELGGEELAGELPGEWEVVQAAVTFPWVASSDGLELQLLALALPASSQGEARYAASGWHREAFFLDLGDGVPRLFSAELVDPQFVPNGEEALVESGQLWTNRYVLYQEKESLDTDPDFYANYPDRASLADVEFVTDDEGRVKQVAINIYDDELNYLYSVEPKVGDRYNPGLLGYDLENPDVLYVRYYANDLLEIEEDIVLSRQYFVPNGALDDALPGDFDATNLTLDLILEGVDSNGNFAYSLPATLGYTWGEAKANSNTPDTAMASSGSGGLGAPLLLLLQLTWLGRRFRSRSSL
ncbi:MAG: hypothetical protein ACSHXK_11065 [Oceanococcus sp.]